MAPASRIFATVRWKLLVVLLIAIGTFTFVGANVHLVYVAFSSHPGCVDHARAGQAVSGQYVAAKSSC